MRDVIGGKMDMAVGRRGFHLRSIVERRVDLEKRISRCVVVARVGVRGSSGNRGKESVPQALRCRGVRVGG
jgi:hypothetical protein